MRGSGLRSWIALASLLSAALASPARAIECGETVSGVLATTSEVDVYTFQAAAGDVVGLGISYPGAANFDPWVELRTPTGASAGFCASSTCVMAPLTASGTYTLRVFDFQSNGAGSYGLTLEALSGSWNGASNAPPTPACSAAPDGMRTIGCGETITGAIDVTGDTDAYSFLAAAGDRIGLHGNVGLELFAPGGARVAFAGGATSCSPPCASAALPATGVYTIRASTAPGPYSFTLESLGASFAGGDSATQCGVTPIACNQTVTGSIDALGDSDTFGIFAQAGEGFAIFSANTSPPSLADLTPRVDGFAPDGSALATLSAPLPQTGRYTLRVTDGGAAPANATGSYELTAVSSQLGGARCPAFPDLRCGETLTQAGSGSGYHYHFYSFTAAAGDQVSLRAEGQVGMVAPGGGPVTYPSNLSQFPITTSGTYHFGLLPTPIVYSVTLDTLTSHFNGGSNTAPTPICGLVPNGTRVIGCGETASGSIDAYTDRDSFVFFAEAGDRVTAQVVPNGIAPAGNFYVVPKVLDEHGVPVSFCSLGCIINSIPTTGPYTIEVSAGLSGQTGPYTVTLTRSPCASDCNDGVDNDGDGFVDLADVGCTSADDLSEAPECSDGRDNDGDGFFDFSGGDPGCASPLGASEDPACDDGFDNDGDGTRDADGGGTGLADAACFGVASNVAETVAPPTGCGIGPELALLVPLLAGLRRRRRAAR